MYFSFVVKNYFPGFTQFMLCNCGKAWTSDVNLQAFVLQDASSSAEVGVCCYQHKQVLLNPQSYLTVNTEQYQFL